VHRNFKVLGTEYEAMMGMLLSWPLYTGSYILCKQLLYDLDWRWCRLQKLACAVWQKHL